MKFSIIIINNADLTMQISQLNVHRLQPAGKKLPLTIQSSCYTGVQDNN